MKPLGWIGSAKDDLLGFPATVVREIGHALFVAQMGGKHGAAKPLQGFGGAGVLEIVEDHAGDAYRAVYTVRFAEVVYVMHVFQKNPDGVLRHLTRRSNGSGQDCDRPRRSISGGKARGHNLFDRERLSCARFA